jgi:tRNA (adenine57-N1/adenine58-N1)-methyltransferase catalytic subunit
MATEGVPFEAGERVVLLDSRGRRYLVRLEAGGTFHYHGGAVPHDMIIGSQEGTSVHSTTGAVLVCFRPRLADFVLKMSRGAQVIYPKDLGQILLLADIHPGVRVLEAGVGSGALSMTLVRAGATVTGYETRPDFAERAQQNVQAFLGAEAAARFTVKESDVYEGIGERDLDRVVLDLPEPWRAVPHAGAALRSGGILVAFTPSITQAATLRQALADSEFELASTVEILARTWHIEGSSVRPDHRMVAHTGFLTSARLLGGVPGGLPTRQVRR